ncbi:hypothetical protein B7P43_G03548 [Cryptotermes secundus]|uniref:GIY-YIG domain-containing protein n=1 Tax=Cryptotermes secundus TaxID=105785 RepID=A0A2J7R560_9NEOP|nr:hypothetical protein B7P43_G03548 [Cryptotermes secundus]
MGETRNAYRILVGNPEGKRPLGRLRRRWVDNIRMDLREIGWDGMDWKDLAQDREQWRALVNTKFLRTKHETTDKYNLCGVYQMTCKDCDLKYVGQTGRNFRKRYKEHIREIKTNGQKSKFAQHILDTTHNYHTIDKAMEILHIEKKGKMLNTLESFHIYELTKQNLQMNEALTDSYNPIYDILIKINQAQEI